MPHPQVSQIRGLNNKAAEDGLPAPEAVIAQNLRFGRGGFQRRPGSVRLLVAGTNTKCMDFDAASSEYVEVPIDTAAWVFGTQFTVEVLVSPDIITGARTVFFAGVTTPTMVLDTNSSNWRWRVWDSAGTLTTVTVGAATLSTTTSIQLVRDGASLTTRLQNVAGGTGTMSATLSTRTPVGNLRIARDDSTNYYDGKIDYLRGFTVARANHADRLLRFPDPMSEIVRFAYDFNASANNIVYDQSRFGNDGEAFNTPTEAATLCHNPGPIRGIAAYTDYSRSKRVLIQSDELLYNVSVP